MFVLGGENENFNRWKKRSKVPPKIAQKKLKRIQQQKRVLKLIYNLGLSVFPAITLRGTERFFSVFVCKKLILFSVFLSDHFRRDWAFFRAFKSLKKTLKSSLKNRWKKRSNVCFRWGKWNFQSLEKTLKSSLKNRSKKRSKLKFIWSKLIYLVEMAPGQNPPKSTWAFFQRSL